MDTTKTEAQGFIIVIAVLVLSAITWWMTTVYNKSATIHRLSVKRLAAQERHMMLCAAQQYGIALLKHIREPFEHAVDWPPAHPRYHIKIAARRNNKTNFALASHLKKRDRQRWWARVTCTVELTESPTLVVHKWHVHHTQTSH